MSQIFDINLKKLPYIYLEKTAPLMFENLQINLKYFSIQQYILN